MREGDLSAGGEDGGRRVGEVEGNLDNSNKVYRISDSSNKRRSAILVGIWSIDVVVS